jgi:hypothetical protein
MFRLGSVLFLVLAVLLMPDVRGIWSGGGQWDPATNSRLDVEWEPDTNTLTGRPFPDVAIDSHSYTDQLQAASWSLGISGFLADLAPNTASFSFVGQVTAVPGDVVVVSTPHGVQWVGRVDKKSETRDAAGDYWTTVTATDTLGALGIARAEGVTTGGGASFTLLEFVYDLSVGVGIEIVMTDDSSGLPEIGGTVTPYTGSVLAFLNDAAKASNAMLGLQRDGTISAIMRESVTPSSVLTLTGINAAQTWVLDSSVDVNVNRWVIDDVTLSGTDTADAAIWGDRPYESSGFTVDLPLPGAVYADWIAYGGSQRPTASGTLIVSDWSQDDLILLNPFEWITEDGTAWQVMSVTHNVSNNDWTVSITADNLLDLL